MKCKQKTEVYSRIVGYFRPINDWNKGKKQEFKDRKKYKVEQAKERVVKLTAENATHFLFCAHAIGRNRKEYTMRCHVLKKMPGGCRVKVLVFGERNWKDKQNISQIRYVPKWRVKRIN